MAGFFRRLFSLGSAEAHSIIDKLEDPVKMTEQGIRDLKKDLDQAMHNFAEVKAVAIRAGRDMEKSKNGALDWERKAMSLLQQGQSGKLDTANAERLASEALARKEECSKQHLIAKKSNETQNQTVQTLQKNIETLKSRIQQYENELVTLKARAKTAAATSKINKQLSNIDSSGTVAMLERMKEKVEEEETLAVAYGDMANMPTSVETEIDQALLTDESSQGKSTSDELAALKAKMGIQ
ncbi:MAG: PspA/IM30 family protein [Proteobacteria bacterium]|nr:PspA/IM30 family protein [Pseudomonadota bacterium]